MSLEFFAGMITVLILVLAVGFMYGLLQFIRLAGKMEKMMDSVDRELSPILRETDLLIRDLRTTVSTANKQMDRLESSLILLDDVSLTAHKFKKEVLNKANKSSIAGFIAAVIGMWKGKDMVEKIMTTRSHRKSDKK